MAMRALAYLGLGLAVTFAAGCDNNTATTDMAGNNDKPDMTMAQMGDCPPKYTENVAACMPSATDYQPRKMISGGFMKCISDDNMFHLVDMQLPPAAARVTAFEAMAGKLWRNPSAPSKDNF